MAITQSVKQFIKNPGGLLSKQSEATRLAYKTLCNSLLYARLKRFQKCADALPKPGADLRVPRSQGFRLVDHTLIPSAQAAFARGQQIIADESRRGAPKKGKAHLNHLIQKSDLAAYPELLNFALDPVVLGIAADYLGELPVLTLVALWHSHAIKEAFSNSQLYHRDHDDIRQFKAFLYLSDVDVDSGPLTIVPADITAKVSKTLGYSRRQPRVADDVIQPHLPKGSEHVLTGPAGTLAFVDTSQVFHYGSRVTSKDRYVLSIQYLTPTNFRMNPFYTFHSYPYADIARSKDSEIQKMVLGVGLAPKVGASHESPIFYE